MRRSHTSFHVLLSLVLFLNGIAGAQASARMLMMHAAEAEVRVETQSPRMTALPAPCHERPGMVAAEVATLPTVSIDESADTGHTTDCCASGACRCECVHHSQAAIVAVTVYRPAVEHAVSAQAISAAHPEAVLLHLIRPPIS